MTIEKSIGFPITNFILYLGLERWLNDSEHWPLVQRTQVQLPASALSIT